MKKEYFKNYALFIVNNRTNSLKLENIYCDYNVALSMLAFYEDNNCKKHISFDLCPCNVPECKKNIDSCMINICYNIANCLNIVDRAFSKGNYDFCLEWFNLAKERSVVASRYLNFIDGTEK